MAGPSPAEQYRAARAAAAQSPEDATAQFNLGYWSARVGDAEGGLAAYRRALALGIAQPEEVWLNIASIYSEQLGRADDAEAALGEALALAPDYPAAFFNLGHVAEQRGERTRALDAFNRVLTLEPDNAQALARLADASEPGTDTELLTRLRNAAGAAADTDVLFALARHEEALGNAVVAWELLARANTLDRSLDRTLDRAADPGAQPTPPLAEIHRACRRAASVEVPDAVDAPAGPVFLCGMFRTGSTLLEQLLAAHPRFAPLGESDFWPRRIAAARGGMIAPAGVPKPEVLEQWTAAYRRYCAGFAGPGLRATDKRPDNVYQLHLLARCLPDARFVITDRDWRDTLVSVFATRLHPQHTYATDPAAIATQIALVDELAGQWQQRYPRRVYRFSYEALIADPEAALKALLAWLGEPWDPACLDFHRLRNSVRTASVWQVREPLQATRAGRWLRFEAPLRDIFGAQLDASSPPAAVA